MSKNIIVTVGTANKVLRDRETCPLAYCNRVEEVISCNKSKLVMNSNGSGSVRFNDEGGKLVVQLTLDKVNSSLSDERSSIILIRGHEDTLSANAYYGVDCDVDFSPRSNTYDLGSAEGYIKALKDFVESWVFSRGSLGAMLIIIDRLDVFEIIREDEAFKGVYLLCSERG